MQPSTSSLCSTSHMDSYLNSSEDCHFLLRALEKQAFENVVFAFRAQGPLTQYTELLLDHLKTALSIDDDEFNIKIRLASNNPHICRLSQQLNPSYDNDARWISLAYDLTGIELAKIRKMDASKNNDTLLFKHIRELNKHNATLSDTNEALSQLMQLPKQPYVPERLRKYLCASESNLMGRISIEEQERNCIPQKPVKNSVGRPRKRKRADEEKRNKEKLMGEMLEKERSDELEKKKREEEKKPSKKAETNERSVETTLFHNNSIRMKEGTSQFSLTHPNSSSITERLRNLSACTSLPTPTGCSDLSFSQLHQCHDLSTELQNQVNCLLSHNKLLTAIKNKETAQKTRSRESEDSTFVCARVRPFSETIQRIRVASKRPVRNSVQIDLSNKPHSTQKLSHLCLSSKYYAETSDRMSRISGYNHYGKLPDEIPNELHAPIERYVKQRKCSLFISSVSILPTDSPPLQKTIDRFAQSQTVTNAIVEADHAYEKASSSSPIESNAAIINASPVSATITAKNDVPFNVHAKNGLVMKNGSCNMNKVATTLASHFRPTLSSLDFIANQHISMGEGVETSGLDFLASTASLLAPMESSSVKCNEKIAATSEG